MPENTSRPVSIAKQVTRYLEENPSATNQDLYDKYPAVRRNTLRHYKSKFIDAQKSKTVTKKGKGRSKIVMTEANIQKVKDFLLKNPKTTYEQLYEAFPKETKTNLKAIKLEVKQEVLKKAKELGTVESPPKQTKQPSKPVVAEEQQEQMQLEIPEGVEISIYPDESEMLETTEVEEITTETASVNVEDRINAIEQQLNSIMTLLKQESSESATAIKTSKKANVDKVRDLEENLLNFVREKQNKVRSELANLEEIEKRIILEVESFGARL